MYLWLILHTRFTTVRALECTPVATAAGDRQPGTYSRCPTYILTYLHASIHMYIYMYLYIVVHFFALFRSGDALIIRGTLPGHQVGVVEGNPLSSLVVAHL